jgi:hypothetical protein
LRRQEDVRAASGRGRDGGHASCSPAPFSG